MESTTLRKEANAYIKSEIERVNESDLLIHWWNHGKKLIYYDGTIGEYLKDKGVVIKACRRKDVDNEYSRDYKVSFTFGSLENMKFTVSNYYDAVQKSILFHLGHLGDKSKFTIDGREYSINFHRK